MESGFMGWKDGAVGDNTLWGTADKRRDGGGGLSGLKLEMRCQP